ncbi:unnamed protein product, partial [marine sediment metagenome]
MMADKSSLPSEQKTHFAKETQNGNLIISADETSLKHMLKLAAPMIVTHISYTIMQF